MTDERIKEIETDYIKRYGHLGGEHRAVLELISALRCSKSMIDYYEDMLKPLARVFRSLGEPLYK